MSTEDEIIMQPGYERREFVNEEPSHALFAAWQNSAVDQANPRADRQFQRQQLHDIVSTAAASQGDPSRRDTIQMYGEITDYLWFGNDHTPIPRGLKRYKVDGDAPILTYDFSQTDYRNMKVVNDLLSPYGMDELLQYRGKMFDEQAPFLFRPLTEALVTNTPGYRLLESFNLDRHVWEERPLTPTERLIERTTIEHGIRRRHNLPATADMRLHVNAQKELSRASRRIDESTRFDRRTVPQTESPATRARNFFIDLAVDELEDGCLRGNELHDIQTVYRGARATQPDPKPLVDRTGLGWSPVIRIATDYETVDWDTESFITWAHNADYLSNPDNSRLRAISTFMVTDALIALLDEGGQDINYGELLQQVIDKYADQLYDSCRDLIIKNMASGEFHSLATLLAMPDEHDELLETIAIATTKINHFAAQQMLSKREYKKAVRNSIGSIKKRPVDDDTTRIIQYHNQMPEGEFDPDSADMVLHFKKIEPGLMPSIPGYELLACDTERSLFAFSYTPDADPYTECSTRIPDDARQRLAALYAQVGLHELAMLVHGTPDLTVSQLTRDITRTNRYLLPRESQVPTFPHSLEDYEAQVGEDGRLHMQCVGSSHFLYLSLKEVFGPGAVSTINGDTLPGNGRRLPAAGHQQTPFTDPGTNRLYILDATSTTRSTAELFNAPSTLTDAARRFIGLHVLKRLIRDRTAPEAPQKQHITPPEEREPTTDPVERRLSLLTQNRDSLILQLRMAHGQEGRPMRHDDLIDHVANLHPDDIVFRVLSTAMLSTSEQADPGEPARILRYIQALKDCDDSALLRRVDPREYTRQPRLLNALEAALSEIQRLNR